MELRPLGRTGTFVSELALGAMTFGREIDAAASATILDTYLEAGGNFVDTADVYSAGGSEEILGELLGSRRDRIVLATKCGLPFGDGPNLTGASRRHISASIEGSLRRLRTDWVDLYQIHMWDPATPAEETLSTLDDLVRRGLVRYVGVSNYAAWQLATSIGLAALHGWEPLVSLQPEYSLVSRDVELELIPLCLHAGLAVIPWSPLGGGVLSGKYSRESAPPSGTRADERESTRDRLRGSKLDIIDAVRAVADECGRSAAQVALNWLLGRPGVTAPLVGARTPEQLRDNLAATGWTLDPEQIARLDAASRPYVGYPHSFQITAGRRAAV